MISIPFFFFQAEDGIRDKLVTGVQTCALPISAIPSNLYEAAELDGVGGWRAFWAITVPYLAPMMLLAITLRLLDAIKLFDTIFIMTGGGPGTKTYTASYYLYTVGFTQFHISQATAGSWIFLLITLLVVTFLVRRLLRVEEK